MVRSLGLLMEMLAIVYSIAAFFGKKVKYDIKTVSFIMSEILLSTLINEYNLPVYLLSVSYFIVFVYGLIEYREGVKETILSCLLTFGTIVVLQQIMFYSVYFLISDNDIIENIFLTNLGCFLMLCGMSHSELFNRFYRAILKNRKIYIGLLLFVCICLLVNLLVAKDKSYLLGKDSLQLLYFTGLMVVVIAEWQKVKIEAEKKKAEMEINKLYNAAYEELIMLIRDRQHDIKNHINTIYSIIYTTNSYEDLVERQKKYCDFVLDTSKETQILLAADNPIIGGFLYLKGQEIKSHSITIEYRVETIPYPLIISEYELVEMWGILVDNAIEALMDSDFENRKIIIGYRREERWDVFYVSNISISYAKEEIAKFFERNYSSKGVGRGIGLDKIRKKLKELDGGIRVDNKSEDGEQYLEFCIMLPT